MISPVSVPAVTGAGGSHRKSRMVSQQRCKFSGETLDAGGAEKMGDKGGKKDKDKVKKQQAAKKEQEEKKKQDKRPRKTP